MKSSAEGSLDIRSFFQVQDEDEDSDDTIDEMEMNSFIPRVEMQPEVQNRYSQEDALEKLLPLVKIARNKKIEAKNDKMMWRHCRYLAVIRYLQLRAAGKGKIKASVRLVRVHPFVVVIFRGCVNRCLNFAFPCST